MLLTNPNATFVYLNRDSRLGQRNDHTLAVEGFDGRVNGLFEFGEALVHLAGPGMIEGSSLSGPDHPNAP
jgi:hypothetical protein